MKVMAQLRLIFIIKKYSSDNINSLRLSQTRMCTINELRL